MSIVDAVRNTARTLRLGEWQMRESVPTLMAEMRENHKQLTVEHFAMLVPGNGASSRFLDSLPDNKKVVFENMVPSHIDHMLWDRGFRSIGDKRVRQANLPTPIGVDEERRRRFEMEIESSVFKHPSVLQGDPPPVLVVADRAEVAATFTSPELTRSLTDELPGLS